MALFGAALFNGGQLHFALLGRKRGMRTRILRLGLRMVTELRIHIPEIDVSIMIFSICAGGDLGGLPPGQEFG
jgi:hypothetical protein